jgi:hypothetical protein
MISNTDYFTKRKEFFRNLFCLDTDVWLWDQSYPKWLKADFFLKVDFEKGLDSLAREFNLVRSPIYCEIVIDIDGENWNDIHNLALKVEQILQQLKAPFYRYSSGGNGLHYHFYIDDSNNLKIKDPDLDKKIIHYFKMIGKKKLTVMNFAELSRRSIKNGIALIFKNLRYNTAHIDVQKITSEKTLIRAEGTSGKLGGYKSLLDSIPDERVLIKNLDSVKFPDKIEFWRPEYELINKMFKAGFLVLYSTLPKYVNTKFKSKKGIPKAFSYIENLMGIAISDGRHRAIDLIILPYLINKGYTIEEAVSIAYDWVQKCNQLRPTNITHTYLMKKAKYVRRKNLLPASKSRALEILSDVPEFIRFLNLKPREFKTF